MGFRAIGFRNPARILAPLALGASVVVVVIVIGAAGQHNSGSGSSSKPAASHLPHHHFYRVRPGDTMLNVSLRTHVPLAQLQQLNPRVDPNTLQAGQRLRLVAATPAAPRKHRAASPAAVRPPHWPDWWPPPPPRVPPARFYAVRVGDTLTAISQRSHVPLPQLKQLNPKLDPNKLQVGQRLRLQ
jgi:LysM repeat protein